MNIDFHYYATYCAAILAGYTVQESREISTSAQFVDLCSKPFLSGLHAPKDAATTQLQGELADLSGDILTLQDITRIWASFHFLPGNLYAEVPKGGRTYKSKYRLLCDVNSDLLVETVNLAKGHGLQAAGIAMHVLADTWAHRYFAGTPSMVINDTNPYFYELLPDGEGWKEEKISFHHVPTAKDDVETGYYIGTVFNTRENSVMYLGHGRAGHLPDYSWIRYKYLPAWGGYEEIVKDNPEDFYHAFCQMLYALQYLHGDLPAFEKERYAEETAAPWESEIRSILGVRRLDSCAAWKALGKKLSGQELPDFDMTEYQEEYRAAPEQEKDDTRLGRFLLAALRQKSMVTGRICQSGNLLAGYAVDFRKEGLKGLRSFWKLVSKGETEK